MLRRYLAGALVAIVPVLLISACGTHATSEFPSEDAGSPSSGDATVLDTGIPPNLGSPDGSPGNPGSGDGGGWVEQPDGAFVFEGDAGGWVEQPDGGFAFEGDAGGWVQVGDGGWLYEGDSGWVEQSDGGLVFEGDAGGWVEQSDGGWVFEGDSGSGDGGSTCTNLQCQQTACDGGGATLTGHVYDPAGNNPLYKVVAYVPNTDPDPILDGINSDSCSCGDLYTGSPIANGITGADGAFNIPNAPVGTNIPIVIQIGKWRNYFTIPSVTCGSNNLDTLLPAKLTLPKTQNETKFSNLPNIAISTGNADSLECLLERVGVSESEYTGTPGALPDGGQPGHIHIFAGTSQEGVSVPNTNPPGPSSSAAGGLWDSDPDIERYDIVLLSCEGGETGNAKPANLADYVNKGGRVFASHYHYAFFFDDQTDTDEPQFPNVADWTLAYQAAQGGSDEYSAGINAAIQTTLPGGGAFPEGAALYTWLDTTVGALTGGLLPITVGRYDAVVSSTNAATPWAQSSGATPASTQYFSWDMPFGAALDDAGEPAYCGRVVYSDLHVGAGEKDYKCTTNPNDCVYSGTTPTGCTQGKLHPDEDAIEFILFDLSSCVTPVTAAPQPPPITPPPPPQPH